MCLESKQRLCKIAKSDIVCYKYLDYDPYIKIYITPYRDFEVKIGETYRSSLKLINTFGIINKGLHSFTHINNARFYGKITVECIIPKGSRYFVGVFNGSPSYCSSKLKYNKLV